MTNLTTTQKYAQQDVVEFWKKLSDDGLQRCEQTMVTRYLPVKGQLLDVGCGAGRAVLALSQAGYQITGLDLSLAMLAAGRALSAEARLSGANLIALPFAANAFDALLMFFGALQHIPGRHNRRRAMAEMARITRPNGRLVLGLDNIAPALFCYGYWFIQKFLPSTQTTSSKTPEAGRTNNDSSADSTLWSRETRRVHPLIWHGRGLIRTLRWRTWPGLVDVTRRFHFTTPEAEPGDLQVAQFSIPSTSGRIYYHIYRADELIEDAASAGWRLLGYHSGAELNAHRTDALAVRRRDKQLFFAFERE